MRFSISARLELDRRRARRARRGPSRCRPRRRCGSNSCRSRSSPSISALTAGISFSAPTQALTKKPMKPSFTPCFFSKTSLYCARSAITSLMSTSLKVVSMAAVFCASFRRRAMVWRSLVMRTRSSRAASWPARARGGAEPARRRAARGGAALARRRQASTSPFSTCPRLPEPCDRSRIEALSAAIFAAAGDGGTRGACAARL